LLAQAWICWFRTEFAMMRALADKAQKLLEAGLGPPEPEEARALQGRIAAMSATVAGVYNPSDEKLQQVLLALELLPPAHKHWRGQALGQLAFSYRTRGSFAQAVQVLEDAMHAVGMQPEPYPLRLLTHLAVVCLLQGELGQAENTAPTCAAYAE
jgi:ATP/maltotriose-dependent transcriptional regulator MalT